MIICLCGSTRYKDLFMEAAEKLTMQGVIILMPHVFHHTDHVDMSAEDKERLDALHKQKIDLADTVVVITDETRYIGSSTKSEIEYAQAAGKSVAYWEDMKDEI